MTRSLRTLAVLAAVAALALPALAADDALNLVPANAVTVGMVRLADMRTSPLSSMLFQQADKMSSDGEAEKFLLEAGLSPTKDVDVLVVATSPRTTLGSDADVLVIAEGRFQPEKLTNALVSRGAVKKEGYVLFAPKEKQGDENGAVAFLSPSMAIAGNERSVVAALAAKASGGTGFRSRGALGMDLGRVDAKATAWALVDVTRAARLAKGGNINTGKGQPGDALQAAIKSLSTVAVWASDTGDTLELGAVGLSGDAETLQLLEDTVRGALSALRLAVKDKSPEMVSVLRRFDVSHKSDSITVEGSIPAATLRELMAKKTAAMGSK
ncbi:MAG TPA: hypothetical protein VFP80_06930 [Thermoanaerobaculia bacterium]|nr:hypothetical protein [Thermoanaerobaculia bacterium]